MDTVKPFGYRTTDSRSTDFDLSAVRQALGHGVGPDSLIAALAAAQHGVVGRFQLEEMGISKRAINGRLARDQLHPVFAGVYSVGHQRITDDARLKAATLACGEGSGVSNRTACVRHRFLDPLPGPIHVTVPWRDGDRPGIVIHRPRRFEPEDLTSINGIPITTVERSLIDIAQNCSASEVRRAVAEADRLGIVDIQKVYAYCIPGRKTKVLRAALAGLDPLDRETRSRLERRFLRRLRERGVERPAVNVPIEGHEADLVWPKHRLVVELDGYGTHRGAAAFESDRARDVKRLRAGIRTLRFTYRQIDSDVDSAVDAVLELLSTPH